MPDPAPGLPDPDPGPLHPDLPDPAALRRRVLLTGLVSLVLFLTIGYVVAATGRSDGWLLVAMVPVYLLVVRPLMRPVRAATALRRRLAYQAFLDQRGGDD